MPILSPFRGLRFDPARVPDLAAVLCPPYDVISPEQQQELLRRDPHNAVRLELPPAPAGDLDDRYQGAARTLAQWRTDGTLRQDPEPSLYVHEMRCLSADGRQLTARGVLGRLRLEPLGPDSSVRAHERTMTGPKEDRYQLLCATGANLSPIVLLHGQAGSGALLDAMTASDPVADTVARDGIRHRLWMHPVDLGDASQATAASELLSSCGRRPSPSRTVITATRRPSVTRRSADRRWPRAAISRSTTCWRSCTGSTRRRRCWRRTVS